MSSFSNDEREHERTARAADVSQRLRQLEEIRSNIERLRRERAEKIAEFKAFTSKRDEPPAPAPFPRHEPVPEPKPEEEPPAGEADAAPSADTSPEFAEAREAELQEAPETEPSHDVVVAGPSYNLDVVVTEPTRGAPEVAEWPVANGGSPSEGQGAQDAPDVAKSTSRAEPSGVIEPPSPAGASGVTEPPSEAETASDMEPPGATAPHGAAEPLASAESPATAESSTTAQAASTAEAASAVEATSEEESAQSHGHGGDVGARHASPVRRTASPGAAEPASATAPPAVVEPALAPVLAEPRIEETVTEVRGTRIGVRRWPLVLGLVAAAAVVAVALWQPWTRSRPGAPASPSAPGQQVARQPEQSPAIPAATSAAATAAPAGTPAGAGQLPATIVQRSLVVKLVVSRPVWMRAVADGRVSLNRTVAGGETITLGADSTVTVRIGDAGAVRLVVNGRDRGLAGRDGQVVNASFP